jgi:hypothetical protein
VLGKLLHEEFNIAVRRLRIDLELSADLAGDDLGQMA